MTGENKDIANASESTPAAATNAETREPVAAAASLDAAKIELHRWHPLPDRAATVYRLVGAITGGLCSLGGGLVPILITGWSPLFKLAAAATLIAAFIAIGIRLGAQRWRNSAWRLDDDALSVRRGRLFFSETLVPRSRVQHLDIERGPIERRHGLATLVVHTAGTRNHALRQSGLDEAQALALRAALLPPASSEHGDA